MKTKLSVIAIVQLLIIVNAFAAISLAEEEDSAIWPTSWIMMDDDPAENGPSDDYRDVKYAYYNIDDNYLYFRLECYGFPDFTAEPESRYKWFIDIDDPYNMGQSGGNVFDAEYLLFVEDSPKPGGDGIGDIYLLSDVDNDGFIDGDWSDYLVNPGNITDSNIAGYRIDGNCLDMYILLDAISNPTYSYSTWATDQENPNFDQAPDIDRSNNYWDSDLSKADLSVFKSDSIDPVVSGDSFTYSILVTNHGPHDAYNVSIVDELSENVVLNNAIPTPTGGSFPTFNWNIPILTVGDAIEILLDVTVDDTFTGIIINTATTSSDTRDPLPGNNEDTEETTIINAADLGIVKSDSLDPVFPGESFSYTLSVTNYGPHDAEDVVIIDSLPDGVTFVSAVPAPSEIVGSTYTWDIASLAEGATTDILINVIADVISSTMVTNNAVVTSETFDLNSENNMASETTIIGSAADLGIVKSDSADPVYPGEMFSYTIEVTNFGPDPAMNVLVSDVLPLGVSFVSATPMPSGNTEFSYWWEFSSLENGESEVIVIDVLVDSMASGSLTNEVQVVSDIFDFDLVNNVATETTDIGDAADLGIVKSDSADPVFAGESFSYTLSMTNYGPLDAMNVVVTDNIPADVTFVSAVPVPSEIVGSTYTWDITSLAAGAITDILVNVVVDNIASTTVTNNAMVTSDTFDMDLENNAAVEVTTIGSAADLSIVKSDSADPTYPGEMFSYTIEVTNFGPDPAMNVVVSDVLPLDVYFVSAIPIPSGNTEFSYWWEFSSLENGESEVIIINVLADTITPGTLTNEVQVVSDIFDFNLMNNVATETTVIESSADLSIVKTGNADTVVAGDNLTYMINVTNHGPNDAENIVISDELPSEVTFKFAVPAPSGNVGQTYYWNVPLLAAGESIVIEINVSVNSGTQGTITNIANVISDTHDTIPDDNEDEEETDVKGIADLSIEKSSEYDSPLYAGGSIKYILNVTNHGPDLALNVNVTDILPAEVTFDNASPLPSGNNGSKYWWIIPSIDVGESILIEINVTVNSGFSGVIINTAYVDEDSHDPDDENNQDDEETTVEEEDTGGGGGNGGGDDTDDGGGLPPTGESYQNPSAVPNGPYYGVPGEEIQFDGSGSHDNDEGGEAIVRFDWKFSDDDIWQNDIGSTPIYIYEEEGVYNVDLRVFDDEGSSSTSSTTVFIAVLNYPPSIPEITGPESGTENTTYSFEVVSEDPDDDDIIYIIDWGDGTSTASIALPSGTSFETSHKWDESGDFTITVTADDGKTDSTDDKDINITEPETQGYDALVLILLLLLLLILLLLLLLEARRRAKKEEEKPKKKKVTAKKAKTTKSTKTTKN